MAMTINGIGTAANSVRFAHDDLVLTLSETVTYTYRWQFVLQIYDITLGGSPRLITTMKAPPNESTCAAFNVNRVVRAMCRKNALDVSDWFSTTGFTAGETGITVQFAAYNEYATVANGPLQTTPPVTANLSFIDGGDQKTSYVEATAQSYKLSGPSSRLLSRRSRIKVRTFDAGGIGFVLNQTYGSYPTYLHIAYYSANGTALNSGALTCPTTYDDDSLVTYAWCYPVGLSSQTANVSLSPFHAGNTGWAYYTAQFTNSIGNAPGFERSVPYTFVQEPLCALGNQEMTFYFLNSLGAYEHFRFTGKSIKRVEVERSEFSVSRGNWGTASNLTAFTYSALDRGKTQLIERRKTIYECHTGLLTDEDNKSITELLLSRSVYVVGNDLVGYQPCVVQTSDLAILEQDYDPMISYSFSVELSNNPTTPLL